MSYKQQQNTNNPLVWPAALAPSPPTFWAVGGHGQQPSTSNWSFTTEGSPLTDVSKPVDISAEFGSMKPFLEGLNSTGKNQHQHPAAVTSAQKKVDATLRLLTPSSPATSKQTWQLQGFDDAAADSLSDHRTRLDQSPSPLKRRPSGYGPKQPADAYAASRHVIATPPPAAAPRYAAALQDERQIRDEAAAILSGFKDALNRNMQLRASVTSLSLGGSEEGEEAGSVLTAADMVQESSAVVGGMAADQQLLPHHHHHQQQQHQDMMRSSVCSSVGSMDEDAPPLTPFLEVDVQSARASTRPFGFSGTRVRYSSNDKELGGAAGARGAADMPPPKLALHFPTPLQQPGQPQHYATPHSATASSSASHYAQHHHKDNMYADPTSQPLKIWAAAPHSTQASANRAGAGVAAAPFAFDQVTPVPRQATDPFALREGTKPSEGLSALKQGAPQLLAADAVTATPKHHANAAGAGHAPSPQLAGGPAQSQSQSQDLYSLLFASPSPGGMDGPSPGESTSSSWPTQQQGSSWGGFFGAAGGGAAGATPVANTTVFGPAAAAASPPNASAFGAAAANNTANHSNNLKHDDTSGTVRLVDYSPTHASMGTGQNGGSTLYGDATSAEADSATPVSKPPPPQQQQQGHHTDAALPSQNTAPANLKAQQQQQQKPGSTHKETAPISRSDARKQRDQLSAAVESASGTPLAPPPAAAAAAGLNAAAAAAEEGAASAGSVGDAGSASEASLAPPGYERSWASTLLPEDPAAAAAMQRGSGPGGRQQHHDYDQHGVEDGEDGESVVGGLAAGGGSAAGAPSPAAGAAGAAGRRLPRTTRDDPYVLGYDSASKSASRSTPGSGNRHDDDLPQAGSVREVNTPKDLAAPSAAAPADGADDMHEGVMQTPPTRRTPAPGIQAPASTPFGFELHPHQHDLAAVKAASDADAPADTGGAPAVQPAPGSRPHSAAGGKAGAQQQPTSSYVSNKFISSSSSSSDDDDYDVRPAAASARRHSAGGARSVGGAGAAAASVSSGESGAYRQVEVEELLAAQAAASPSLHALRAALGLVPPEAAANVRHTSGVAAQLHETVQSLVSELGLNSINALNASTGKPPAGKAHRRNSSGSSRGGPTAATTASAAVGSSAPAGAGKGAAVGHVALTPAAAAALAATAADVSDLLEMQSTTELATAAVAKALARVVKLSRENEALTRLNAQLTQELAEQHAAVSEHQARVKMIYTLSTQKGQEARAQLADVQLQLAERMKRIMELEQQLAAVQAQKAAREAELEAQIASLAVQKTTQVAELQAQLARLSKREQAAQESAAGAERGRQEAEAAAEAAEAAAEAAREEAARVQAEGDKAARQHAQATEWLERDLQQLKAYVAEIEQALKSKTEECVNLGEQLGQERERGSALRADTDGAMQAQVAHYESRLAEMAAQLEAASWEAQHLQGLRDETQAAHEAALAVAAQQAQKLAAELGETKAALIRSDALVASLQQEQAATAAEHKALVAQLQEQAAAAELKSRLDAANKEIQVLVSARGDLEQQLQAAHAAHEATRASLQQELDALRSKMENDEAASHVALQQELATARADLASTRSELAAVVQERDEMEQALAAESGRFFELSQRIEAYEKDLAAARDAAAQHEAAAAEAQAALAAARADLAEALSTAQQATTAAEEAAAELTTAQEQVALAKEDAADWRSQLSSALEDLHVLQQQASEAALAREEVEELRAQCTQLEGAVAQARQQAEEAAAEALQQAEAQAAEARQQAEEAKKKMTEEKKRQAKEIERLRQEADKAGKEVKALQAQLSAAQSSAAGLARQLDDVDDWRGKAMELDEELAGARQSLAAAQANAARVTNDMKTRTRQHEEEMAGHREALRELQAAASQHEQQVEELRNHMLELREHRASLQDELDMARAELTSAREAAREHQQLYDKVKAALAEKSEEVAALTQQLAAAQAHVQDVAARVAELEGQLAAASEAAAAAGAEVQAAVAARQEVESRVLEMRAALEAARVELGAMRSEHEAMKEAHAKQQAAAADAANAATAAAQAQAAQAPEDCAASRLLEEVSTLRQQRSKLVQELDWADADRLKLQTELRSAQRDLEAARQEVKQMKAATASIITATNHTSAAASIPALAPAAGALAAAPWRLYGNDAFNGGFEHDEFKVSGATPTSANSTPARGRSVSETGGSLGLGMGLSVAAAHIPLHVGGVVRGGGGMSAAAHPLETFSVSRFGLSNPLFSPGAQSHGHDDDGAGSDSGAVSVMSLSMRPMSISAAAASAAGSGIGMVIESHGGRSSGVQVMTSIFELRYAVQRVEQAAEELSSLLESASGTLSNTFGAGNTSAVGGSLSAPGITPAKLSASKMAGAPGHADGHYEKEWLMDNVSTLTAKCGAIASRLGQCLDSVLHFQLQHGAAGGAGSDMASSGGVSGGAAAGAVEVLVLRGRVAQLEAELSAALQQAQHLQVQLQEAATSRDEYRELVGRLKEQVEVLHDALVEERAKSSSPAASVSTTSHRHQARRHRRQSLSAAGGKSRSGIIDMEASSEAGPHGDAGSEVGGSGSGSDAEGDGDGASRSGGEEGGDGVAPEAVEELVRGVASLTTRHEDALSQLQAVTAERDALQEQLQAMTREVTDAWAVKEAALSQLAETQSQSLSQGGFSFARTATTGASASAGGGGRAGHPIDSTPCSGNYRPSCQGTTYFSSASHGASLSHGDVSHRPYSHDQDHEHEIQEHMGESSSVSRPTTTSASASLAYSRSLGAIGSGDGNGNGAAARGVASGSPVVGVVSPASSHSHSVHTLHLPATSLMSDYTAVDHAQVPAPRSGGAGVGRGGGMGHGGSSQEEVVSAARQMVLLHQQHQAHLAHMAHVGGGPASAEEVRQWQELQRLLEAVEAPASGSSPRQQQQRSDQNEMHDASNDADASGARSLALVPVDGIHGRQLQAVVAAGGASNSINSAGQQAWDSPDVRAAVVARAVGVLQVMRDQNRKMSKVLRRMGRDGGMIGQLEALRRDNQKLSAKYAAAQMAHQQAQRAVHRLGQENRDLHELLMQRVAGVAGSPGMGSTPPSHSAGGDEVDSLSELLQ